MMRNNALKNKGRQDPTHEALPAVYITGDKHRNYKAFLRFVKKQKLTRRDTIVILGDSGFNYFGDRRDDALKEKISQAGPAVLCIHGNKEQRPEEIPFYKQGRFLGGTVWYEEQYPNLLFAQDGQIYTLAGRDAVVIGGAHSVDRLFCLENDRPVWEHEDVSDETKKQLEAILAARGNRIDYILSHTVPYKYEPREMFLSNCKKKKTGFIPEVDKTTEKWLGKIEESVYYRHWFAGHYHTDKQIDKLSILFDTFVLLEPENSSASDDGADENRLYRQEELEGADVS